MDSAYWIARWDDGRIGFHEGAANAMLARHIARLGSGGRVFVPLCGKAEDLAWLAARGFDVVGVELSELAVRAFFAEHDLEPRETAAGGLRHFTAGRVTIVCGDVFDVTAAALGPITAFYDRAALVALPPETRTRYVAHLRGVVPPGSRGLLVTFEYPQDRMPGPPFAVLEAEVRAAFAGAQVEAIEEGPADNARLEAQGIPGRTRCYALTL